MKTINLTQGKVALVDDEDYEYLNQWKWYALNECETVHRSTSYAIRKDYSSGRQKAIFMHRVIMNTLDGMETDHMDHNGLNNQRSNLRRVTHQQNSMNQKTRKGRRYTGVTITKKGYIRATITVNNKYIYLGHFSTEEAAALAFNEAALKYRGEFARLNIIL